MQRNEANNFKPWTCAMDLMCALVAAVLLLSFGTSSGTLRPSSAATATVPESHQPDILEELLRQTAELEAAIEVLSEELRQRLSEADALGDPQAIAAEIERLRDRLLAKQAELETLEKRIAENRQRQAATQGSIVADPNLVRKDFAEAERLYRELVDREAQLLALSTAKKGGGFQAGRLARDMDSIIVVLVRNRVLVPDDPFYSHELVYSMESGRAARYIKVDRVRDGEVLSDALAPGGILAKILAETDKEKEYIQFLVTSDSISAYRAVIKTLAERGIRYNWTTWTDKTIYISQDQIESNSGSAGTGTTFMY